MVLSFQLELEHLISHEASWSILVSGVAGTDVPSLHAFLKVLLGNRPEYDFNGIDYDASPRMCYHVDFDDLAKEEPKLTPPN